jgi:hypothetical protein
MDWDLVKKELYKSYKKELFLGVVTVLLFGFSLFLFIKEYREFSTNLRNLKKFEMSYYSQYQEIMKLKEKLKSFDLNATRKILVTPFSGVYDLRDLSRAYFEIKALTQTEGQFFVLKEMLLLKEKEKVEDIPKLKINGEIVIFIDREG